MIVELIGPAGAGKSTLAARLAEHGVRVVEPVELRVPSRTLPVRRPRLAAALALAAPRSDTRRLRRIVHREAGVSSLDASQLVVVDEGPRQWAIYGAARGLLRPVGPLLAALRPVDLIVNVDASPEQTLHRMRARAGEHWVHMFADNDVLAIQEDARRITRDLLHDRNAVIEASGDQAVDPSAMLTEITAASTHPSRRRAPSRRR